MPTRPRVAVMGGSLGGLTAALLLRDAGCEVDVYERSRSALDSRGAGIVSHDMTMRYIAEHELMDVAQASAKWWRYVDRSGATLVQEPCRFRFTSWNSIHKALFSHFDAERYHLGHEVTSFDQDDEGVSLHLADHSRSVRCDLLVAADGISSTARARLLPGIEPAYAGYVGWRGTIAEAELSEQARQAAGGAIIYHLLADSHILTYPIPNHDGDVRRGARLINFVWYRNVPEGAPLETLMTDIEGVRRPLSVPPGAVRAEAVKELRAAASALPDVLAEVVVGTREPFLQAIFDLAVPRMAFGRIGLMGDAAFAARPHAAAGTAKAAADAWALRDAVMTHDDVRAALAAWEAPQLQLGTNLVERSRTIGQQSQFDGTWDIHGPTPFGLYGPGQ